jgi:hypothetical protein
MDGVLIADGLARVAVGVARLGAVGGAVHVPVEAVGVLHAALGALDAHRLRFWLRPLRLGWALRRTLRLGRALGRGLCLGRALRWTLGLGRALRRGLYIGWALRRGLCDGWALRWPLYLGRALRRAHRRALGLGWALRRALGLGPWPGLRRRGGGVKEDGSRQSEHISEVPRHCQGPHAVTPSLQVVPLVLVIYVAGYICMHGSWVVIYRRPMELTPIDPPSSLRTAALACQRRHIFARTIHGALC